MSFKKKGSKKSQYQDGYKYDQVATGKIYSKQGITEADMEGKDEKYLWISCREYGRKYFAGFSVNDKIELYYKDPDGKHQIETVKPEPINTKVIDINKWHGYYFYIRTSEWDELTPRKRNMIRKKVKIAKGKIRTCPINSDYMRIYTHIEFFATFYNKISGREHLESIYIRNEEKTYRYGKSLWKGSFDAQAGGAGGTGKHFGLRTKRVIVTFNDSQKKNLNLIRLLEKYEVEFFEADLTPKQRFMADHDIFIENHVRGLFFDFETDDTISGFTNIEKNRILTVAYSYDFGDDKAKVYYLAGDHYTKKDRNSYKDDMERNMLLKFRKILEGVEILYAWNGQNFDFPMLRERFKYHGIEYKWENLVWVDLLTVWRRYFQRGASVNTSFALNNIGNLILKKKKLPLQNRKIIDLYTGTKEDREILKRYNIRDVEILQELEEFTGFGAIDQTFCRIGNCMLQDYHVSTKVDGLMLKKGYKSGYHFPTRKHHKREGYVGGLVLEPVVGLHKNVANFDFASLYPTMMTTFNISPETLMDDDCTDDDVCSCPSGTKFKNGPIGFIPQMFKGTLMKRKKYTDLQKTVEVGTDLFLLYYRLAYSFKRLGLSFYGELGNNSSRFYSKALAEGVTLSGQHFLKYTMDLASERKFIPLYGDTDSIFIKVGAKDAKEFETFCNNHYTEYCVDKFNIDPKNCNISLEYENYFTRIFFVSKKRYAGLMTMYKGNESDFIEVKGLEMMRSDGLAFTRILQEDIINKILRDKIPLEDLVTRLKKERRKVINHKLSMEQITITQAVTKNPKEYKSKLVHVSVAEDMIKRGLEFFIGMKIPYVVIGSKPRLQGILNTDYDPDKTPYDELCYWNRKIYPAIERIVEVCYPNYNWKDLYVKKTKKKKQSKKV